MRRSTQKCKNGTALTHLCPWWNLQSAPFCLCLPAWSHTSFLLFFSWKKGFSSTFKRDSPIHSPSFMPSNFTDIYNSSLLGAASPQRRGRMVHTNLTACTHLANPLLLSLILKLCLCQHSASPLRFTVPFPWFTLLTTPPMAFLKILATIPILLWPGWPLIPLLSHSTNPHAYGNGPCLNVISLTLLYEFRIIHIAQRSQTCGSAKHI